MSTMPDEFPEGFRDYMLHYVPMLLAVRESVVKGLEFYETVKDNPEWGGSIIDAIADEVTRDWWKRQK